LIPPYHHGSGLQPGGLV